VEQRTPEALPVLERVHLGQQLARNAD